MAPLRRRRNQAYLHVFLLLVSLVFILPFLMIIAVSFSSEEDLITHGYKLIPRAIDLTAYNWVFRDVSKILNAYLVTAAQSLLGTFLAVLVMGLCGYAISRRNYTLRRAVTIYIFITMLFGGGLVPSYIINTQWYRLGNKFWVYIFPVLANGFQIIVFRTFFSRLPQEVFESAYLDGAGEFGIFFKIVLPMSTPVIAAISFLFLQGRWDEWYTCLLYIRKDTLYTLQYLLQRILLEAEFLEKMAAEGQNLQLAQTNIGDIPTESMRYALVVIAAGPMLFVFPFFQKYFAAGLTVGSVKG